jgi:hypothetical protein
MWAVLFVFLLLGSPVVEVVRWRLIQGLEFACPGFVLLGSDENMMVAGAAVVRSVEELVNDGLPRVFSISRGSMGG